MDHQYYMQKALELAALGWPHVAPNPMVGCVIVKNDKIVAEGYHQKFGEAHAEVNAIANLPAGISPSECTLYVTLEPCTHFGKTPPCSDLVIKRGFRKVVIACTDPNPMVSGKGLSALQAKGIRVESGILEQQARFLNRRFITFFEKRRPYIILKWAMSSDGYISRQQTSDRAQNRISREPAMRLVHQLRAESMAILVGKNTVLADNPHLTTRLVNGKNPIRIFVDGKLEVNKTANILNTEAPTIVFNYIKDEQVGTITYVRINNADVVRQILDKLYELNIQSLIVEGGSRMLQDFIDKQLWDEALVFQNPDLVFGEGVKGPVFPLKQSFENVAGDKLFRYYSPGSVGQKG